MSKIEYPADGGGPAFPETRWDDATRQSVQWMGMSLRTYAAIHLGVPESGIDWLDQMIAKKVRRDLAGQAMQGYVASYPEEQNPEADHVARTSLALAAALLQEKDHE